MSSRVFIDTNVLVYLRDAGAAAKRGAAAIWLKRLVDVSAAYINLQVLNEYMAVVLRKEPSIPIDELKQDIETFAVWGQRPLDQDDMRVAWMVRERFGFQWFDCLLVASASNDGCDVFLSEDMIDGARFGDLVIVNPFLHHPDEFLT